jgi:MFS family permease
VLLALRLQGARKASLALRDPERKLRNRAIESWQTEMQRSEQVAQHETKVWMSENSQGDGTPPGEAGTLAAAGWLNRNVIGMGLASLLSDAGHEMATAVLPGFLQTLAAPAYALGIIEGFSDALSSFVKLGAGWWGDRIGHRKGIVTAGYVLTGTMKAVFAFALGWPLIFLGRALAWIGRGIRGPLRNAMLAESVAPRDRGKAFGFHRAGDTLGAIIGPLVGAAVLHWLEPFASGDASRPYRVVFLLTLIPGLGSALAFAWLVRENRRNPNPHLPFWASVRALPAGFRRFLVGAGVFGLGDFSPTLLILAATKLLTPRHGIVAAAQVAALLYAMRNFVYAAASYPIGAISDRYGRRGLLVLGYVVGGLLAAGIATAFLVPAASLLAISILFALSGISVAAVDSLEGALTADLVPSENSRGTAFGVLGTVNGIGDFISSTVVGFVWWGVSPVAGFVYAALSMLIGAGLLYRMR